MKNFNWSAFTQRIAIRSSVNSVYEAWMKPELIVRWFLSYSEYETSNGVKRNPSTLNEVGDEYYWSWYTHNIVDEGLIMEANGKDFFSFTFAGNCLVEVSLEQIDEYTYLTLIQKNIPEDDSSKENIRLGCDSGWSFFLVNLKSVLEGGLDLRNKEVRFKGINN